MICEKMNTIEKIANALKNVLKEKLKLYKSSEIKKNLVYHNGEEKEKSYLLDLLKTNEVRNCKQCKLCDVRNNIVFGSGKSNAELVFIGEAPGEEEDLCGLPFVGKSGELLDKMIYAMGLFRQQVYICNIIKCRPPKNRNPEPEEIEACSAFLKKQLDIIKPKIIVTLGYFACKSLIESNIAFGILRGNWMIYRGIDVMPTFHPAYLLRNPKYKKETWEHLKKVIIKLQI